MKLLLLLGLAAAVPARAESARILKVLPSFLDQKGRQSLQPSLYERDAYQAQLRGNPRLRAALRFDIEWKAAAAGPVNLRVEARGTARGEPQQVLLEKTAKKGGWLGSWTALTLEGEAYKKFGDLIAWRVTLWRGDTQLAEQKSFLW